MTPHLILPSHFVFRPRMHTNGRRADTRTRLIRDPSDSSSPYSRDNLQMRKGCCGDEKRDGERERELNKVRRREACARTHDTYNTQRRLISLAGRIVCGERERAEIIGRQERYWHTPTGLSLSLSSRGLSAGFSIPLFRH